MQSPSNSHHEIIYNNCYGGYSFSKLAMDEYHKTRHTNTEAKAHPREESLRDDPVMIGVVKDLGCLANGMCAQLEITTFPKKFANAWSIGEYDGHEQVIIDDDKYRLDMIRSTLANEEQSELKVKLLAILDEEHCY
jgi:hypothetical protein